MKNKKKELYFISRHKPNDGEIALAKKLGYDEIKQVNITFISNPQKELMKAKIFDKKIAIVAPTYISNILLNKGYTIIEFVNSTIKREKMMFVCKGAFIYKLNSINGTSINHIHQKYVECPIPIEKQVESSMIPEKREN